jgi:PAS domain S-box-containing protein
MFRPAVWEVDEMKDQHRTKEQLMSELVEMRQRVAELEAVDTERLSAEQAGKRAEEALREAEKDLRLFKTIVESSQEAIAISDPDGGLVYVNPAHEKLFGRSLEEAQQINYRDYYPPESVEILNREVAPALARGESWEGVLDVFDARGRRFPLWERADTVRDAGARCSLALVSCTTSASRCEQRRRCEKLTTS